MATHDMPPTSGRPLPDADVDHSDDDLPERAPPRFGRLALWVVSASALAVGVAGTVAYRVWFSHDQRAYVEAMANARETLGMNQAARAQQTLSYGAVDTSIPPVRQVAVANADVEPRVALDTATNVMPPDDPVQSPTPTAIPAAPGRLAAASADAAPVPATSAREAAPNRANRASNQAVAQNRRHPPQRAKQPPSLFARMGSFFHRVNYRQNVNGSQRDEYSRP
ncbi:MULTISPECIES: hypothetical protein [unclassified Caballeronia]|uniref:hypothetical protein n=1 Tax=unclassified Caballeronia TaxID=2646786 RepID=UPI002855DB49|nr:MULTISPECIES: hypothetical protein [unclassified Caballeronia]MDR5750704.1 hypothetical protein [Caballeronia sp. LZ024]MDR5842264.1 hypothetical protein [Caballeronia sp. LZ031]